MNNSIDMQHIEHREFEGCKVTLYFAPTYNPVVVKNVLESLLDVFDKRVCTLNGVQIISL